MTHMNTGPDHGRELGLDTDHWKTGEPRLLVQGPSYFRLKVNTGGLLSSTEEKELKYLALKPIDSKETSGRGTVPVTPPKQLL